MTINDDVAEEGHYYNADHDSGLGVHTDIIYTEVDDPIANNKYVDDLDKGAKFIDHPKQSVENDDRMSQYVVNNIEFDPSQIEQSPPSVDGSWVCRIFYDKSNLLHALEEWHIAHNVRTKIDYKSLYNELHSRFVSLEITWFGTKRCELF